MSYFGYNPFIYNGVSLSPLDNIYLSLTGVNLYPKPFKLIPGTNSRPSLSSQEDSKTGVWFPEEGCLGIALIGFDHYRFYNSRIEYRTKSGTLSTLNMPTVSGEIIVDSTFTMSVVNGEASATISPGMVVKLNSSGQALLAQSNSSSNLGFALATQSIAPSATGIVKHTGKLALADWTDVIGATNLTVGAWYYLSDTTAGMLTTTAPTIAQKIGYAISSTELLLKV